MVIVITSPRAHGPLLFFCSYGVFLFAMVIFLAAKNASALLREGRKVFSEPGSKRQKTLAAKVLIGR